jgi:hypothetical protein
MPLGIYWQLFLLAKRQKYQAFGAECSGRLWRNGGFVEGLARQAGVTTNMAAEPVLVAIQGLFVSGVHALPVAFKVVAAAVHAGSFLSRAGSMEDSGTGAILGQFYAFILIGHGSDSRF